MSRMTNSPGGLREPSLAEIIAIETVKINALLGRDSFIAARHIEQMNVAASYVSQFLGQGLVAISISEVIHVNCYAVAQNVASEAGQEAAAGAARIVRNLVQLARESLREMDFAPFFDSNARLHRHRPPGRSFLALGRLRSKLPPSARNPRRGRSC